jgi:8-oxo-dGTP pyrophosphatase MutT (NUDIX family)
MATERFKFTPAVYLVLEQGGKLLFIRRYNTGYRDGEHTLVAGHHDGGVPMVQSMAREAKEEIGIDIDPKDLKFVHLIHRIENGNERVDIYFKADIWKGEVVNNEPHKCDDMSWFSPDDLPDNVIPHVKQVVTCIRKGITYSTDGF